MSGGDSVPDSDFKWTYGDCTRDRNCPKSHKMDQAKKQLEEIKKELK